MRTTSSRTRALGLAIGVGLVATPLAMAATTDPFSSGIPTRDYASPEGQRYASGEVNEQSGAASYAIPIALPPGRLGMQPSLALTYSSSGALRGGLAVGWSMDLPFIERDPDYPYGSPHYRVGGQRLVPVTGDPMGGATYRTEVDSSFARYQYDGSLTWTVLTTDGHVRHYAAIAPGRFYLSDESDAVGNTVRYYYSPQTVNGATELFPTNIYYTSNPAAAIAEHAWVQFVYAPLESCNGAPVGASVDYHFGTPRLAGSRRLIEVRASVKDTSSSAFRLARKVTLGYDATELGCSASQLRYLKTVDVSGYTAAGVETREPTIRLGYGATQRVLDRTITGANTPQEAGTGFGATSGYMDMDGDGRADYVEILTGSKCQLRWSKGLPDGAFETRATTFDLPTAAWQGTTPNRDEHCTLSGQLASRLPAGNLHWCRIGGIAVDYHFADYDGDGRIDLLTALRGVNEFAPGGDFAPMAIGKDAATDGYVSSTCPTGTTYDHAFVDSGGVEHAVCNCDPNAIVPAYGCHAACDAFSGQYANSVTGTCSSTGGIPSGGGGPTSQCDGPDDSPEKSNGRYLWRLQRGSVAGFGIVSQAQRIESPVPLPSGSQDLKLAAPIAAPAAPPTLVDIDADGYLDIVTREVPGIIPTPTLTKGYLYVRRGLPTGDFETQGRLWAFRTQVKAGSSYTDHAAGSTLFLNENTLAFRDLNGDGAPDLMFLVYPTTNPADATIAVAYNMVGAPNNPGAAVPSAGVVSGAFSTPIATTIGLSVERSRVDATFIAAAPNDWPDAWATGYHAALRKLIDLQGDGTAQIVELTPSTGASISAAAASIMAYRFVGGATNFQAGALALDWEPVESLIYASGNAWRRKSDAIDLTGDGLPDLVTYDKFGNATLRTDSAPASLRLLTTIDNGHGGVTRFDYAYTNDAAVATLGTASLAPHRVVKSITVEPGSGQPAMSTQYAYAGPVSGRASPLDPTHGSFKGFTTVTTTSSGQQGASARQTVSTYEYSVLGNDWGGRLQKRLVSINVGGTWVPLEHDAYVYAPRNLFGGVVTMTAAATHEHRICAVGSTADTCPSQVEHTTTTTEYQQYPTTGAAAFYLQTVTRINDFVYLERYQRSAYDVRYTATRSQILPTVQDQGGWIDWGGPVFLPAARSETVYDTRGLPTERRVSQDGAVNAISRTTFDSVGNPTLVVRPRQVAVNSALGTTIGYDTNKVYATTTLDELSRLVTTKYDTGTGQLLEKVGPDSRSTCAPGVKCATWQWQTERWVRDGLGRELSHERSFDPAAGSYGYVQRTDRITAYYDSEIPTRRITWTLRDPSAAGGLAWVIDQQRFDGAGRVTDATAMRQIAGSPDGLTIYHYDGGGGLASVETPDPRYDTGARVTTTFTRDGAGRPTLVTHPDGGTEQVEYRGLDTVFTRTGGGQSSRTLERNSQLGEVVQRHEFDNPLPGQVAITTYGHDVLGRVDSVSSADNTYSTVGYDWAGRRTWVNQSGHVWAFTYDLDGNLTASREPMPTSANAALYTTSTIYDLVDRPTSTTPATHGDTSRWAELGIGTRSQTYRTSTDQVASLTLPFGTVTYTYDADGHVARETRALRSPTMPTTITQWVERTYDALGTPLTVAWDDGTLYKLTTDARGAIATAQWKNPATSTYETLASYGRGVAGQPRIRTGYGQARSWTYDVLGRVTYDWIYQIGASTSLAQLQTSYDGLGNVAGQSGSAYGLVQDSTYTYDAVRRLTHATGAGGYDAAFTYSAAGNIRTATIAGTSAPRAVTYAYGAADPQAVDTLTSIGNGAVVGAFTYDVAGQMVTRATPAGTASMAWDPEGILREVASPTGVTRTFVGPGAEKMIVADLAGITLYFADSETQLSVMGVQNRRYHHVAAGEPIARIETAGSTTKVELQYADTLQNLRLAVDKNSVVTAAFTYGAFGEVLGAYGANDHKRQFNGKDAEPIAGLRNYGYRSYDPYALRWISSDPVSTFAPDFASPQEANRYAFAANNPVRYLDPDGRADEEPGGVSLPDDVSRPDGDCGSWLDTCDAEPLPEEAPVQGDTTALDLDSVIVNDDKTDNYTTGSHSGSGVSAGETRSAVTFNTRSAGSFSWLNFKFGAAGEKDSATKKLNSGPTGGVSLLSWNKTWKIFAKTSVYANIGIAEYGADARGESFSPIAAHAGIRQQTPVGEVVVGAFFGTTCSNGKCQVGRGVEVGFSPDTGSHALDSLTSTRIFSPFHGPAMGLVEDVTGFSVPSWFP